MKAPEFLSKPVSSIARRVIHSEPFYRLMAWGVPRFIGPGLLEDPTDQNILKAVRRLNGITRLTIPDGQDRVLESAVVGRLEREFKNVIETGEDTNLTRKTKRTLTLMGSKYLKTTLVDFGARFVIGKLEQHLNSDSNQPYITALVVQPNSDCNAKPRCPGCFAATNQGKLNYETLDRVVN